MQTEWKPTMKTQTPRGSAQGQKYLGCSILISNQRVLGLIFYDNMLYFKYLLGLFFYDRM